MSERPRCIYKRGDFFFAQIKVRGEAFKAPLRNTIEAAKEDLLRLRKDHPSPKIRLLPRFVYRHCGFRKGYFAKRRIADVQHKGPLRAQLSAAVSDATNLAAAKTADALAEIQF